MSLKAQKKKRQKKRKIDRLSNLPDDLLLHIMQFMILKHSVRTCILSKRWKNLWKYSTNINFHRFDRYNSGVIFDEFVVHFLSCRDNSVPIHSISYVNKGCLRDSFILVDILEYAESNNVQQLEINAQTDHQISDFFELLPSIFNCTSLTSLNLCLWDAYKPTNTKMFPKSLNLPALKTLKLGHFTFFTSGDNGYAEPFSTCNMLSKLDIYGCSLQDDAQGLCISNSRVSNLAITRFPPNSNIHKVILCTPKLTSLTIKGTPPTLPALSICNLTLLEELKFDCRFGYTMREDILIGWLHLLAKVKIITINFKILEVIVDIMKKNGSMRAELPSFVKLKSLKVESKSKTCDEERVREMVTYLLQNSLHHPPPLVSVTR